VNIAGDWRSFMDFSSPDRAQNNGALEAGSGSGGSCAMFRLAHENSVNEKKPPLEIVLRIPHLRRAMGRRSRRHRNHNRFSERYQNEILICLLLLLVLGFVALVIWFIGTYRFR
jgi:hypothetical protein